jgi:putative ABC transport system permease protein
MDALIQDFRLAFRTLRRSPGFTATAALTLALGIGATTAIFAALNAVVLNPLPYEKSQNLAWIGSRVPGIGPDVFWGVSEAGYGYFRKESRTLEAIGAFSSEEMNVADQETAWRARVALVTADLFRVLRARPAIGRLIAADDDRPNERRVAVLGYGFWQREYRGDRSVIGTTLELDGSPTVVIGVTEPGFQLPDLPVDIWIPLGLDPAKAPVNAHWLAVIGRLRQGATMGELQTELSSLTARFPDLFPRAYSRAFMQQSAFTTAPLALRDYVVGESAGTLWILLAAVGLVLLIACANVANLFMVRTEARRRELAIRGALGATTMRLAQTSLAESLLVALIACAGGLALAYGGIQLLKSIGSGDLPRAQEIGFDATTLVFAVVVALCAGVAFGLFPVLRGSVDASAIRGASMGYVATAVRQRARRALVAGQVALALVLLSGAGLVIKSYERLRAVEIGVHAEGVLTVGLRLPVRGYADYPDVLRFYHALIEQVRALPDVQNAGAGPVPLEGFAGCAVVYVEDHPLERGEQPPCVSTQQVAPGYFEALGIPVRGEAPDWLETETMSAGVVVTPALARRLWPGQDPIGKGIRRNSWGHPFYRVVGVSGDLRVLGPDRPLSEAVFFPMMPIEGAPLWAPPRRMTLIVRTRTTRPEVVTNAIRGVLKQIDPSMPIGSVATMDAVVAHSVAIARASFASLLLTIAGMIALALSIVGLYGAVSYIVGRRASEIGIRMALGAQARQVGTMILGEAMTVGATGVLVGLVGALSGGTVLRALLFEVSPADPLTLLTVAVILLTVTAAASVLPARRASRVDPMVALRGE